MYRLSKMALALSSVLFSCVFGGTELSVTKSSCIDSDMITEERLWTVYGWCATAYLQHGIKIAFPANTDPRKTYQWRYLNSLVNKLNEWEFDDETSKKFIAIAVSQAKQKKVLNKGLACFLQSNLLDICYRKLTAQAKEDCSKLDALKQMKTWFDLQTGDKDPLRCLLHRSSPRAFSNIVMWHQSNRISPLFIALSKSCSKAVFQLQSNDIESNLLPSLSTLYLTRVNFLSESNNLNFVSTLFGTDWRSK